MFPSVQTGRPSPCSLAGLLPPRPMLRPRMTTECERACPASPMLEGMPVRRAKRGASASTPARRTSRKSGVSVSSVCSLYGEADRTSSLPSERFREFRQVDKAGETTRRRSHRQWRPNAGASGRVRLAYQRVSPLRHSRQPILR